MAQESSNSTEAATLENYYRSQIALSKAMLAELRECKGLLLEVGKLLIDIQAVAIDIKKLAHPTALLNTLAHIKDRAAEEEAREQAKAENANEHKQQRRPS